MLITGGTGSLGKSLSRRIVNECKKLIIFSRDELKQSEMQREIPDARYFLGDIRDKDRLKQVFQGVDVVIHAAALKQVPALEYNPTEAIKTNVLGSTNVAEAAIECGVEKVIFISTDKAVNPVNLYGATKMCAEKLLKAANAYNKTKFSTVRYGNVIGSRGSVVPLFQKLIENGITEFPITHLEMTRFWITLDAAVDLVLFAYNSEATGTFVPLLPAMKVTALAEAMSPNCTFKEIGIRPGEKVHEKLTSDDTKGITMVTFCDDENCPEAMHGVPEFVGFPNYSSQKPDKWLTGEEFLCLTDL